jgi:hypothetical protein
LRERKRAERQQAQHAQRYGVSDRHWPGTSRSARRRRTLP